MSAWSWKEPRARPDKHWPQPVVGWRAQGSGDTVVKVRGATQSYKRVHGGKIDMVACTVFRSRYRHKRAGARQRIFERCNAKVEAGMLAELFSRNQ